MAETEKAVETTLRILSEEYARVFCPDAAASLGVEQSAIGELATKSDELRRAVERAAGVRKEHEARLALLRQRNDATEAGNRRMRERLLSETAAVFSALRRLDVILA